MLGYYLLVAIVAGVVLAWAAAQPNSAQAAGSDEKEAASLPSAPLDPAQVRRHFPPGEIDRLRVIAQDTMTGVQAGRQADAKARVQDLETVWDQDQATLQPMDTSSWRALDTRIDAVLSAIRSPHPGRGDEVQALNLLLASLG